jgi:FlaA1/EpsC-like NDP-sugar epimerase
MIRLAGLVPDQDIKIEYVGLRPGEKLYEEVITKGEHVQPTHHEKIKVFRGPSPSHEEMLSWMNSLDFLLSQRDSDAVVAHMASLVPEYRPAGRWQTVCEEAARLRGIELAAAGD